MAVDRKTVIIFKKNEKEKSLLELLNTWPERMPFLDKTFWVHFKKDNGNTHTLHPFWNA
jgi:hypothetical protein